MSGMRLAALVMSHAAPAAIPLHAAYFASVADLFVHVDTKVPQEDIPACPTAHYIARRPVSWGGWSMVEVIFDLLAAARAAGEHDLYLLLSDDCAALRPPLELATALDPSRDHIWINTDPPEWCQRRYRDYSYYDHPTLSPRAIAPHERVMDPAFFAAVAEASELLNSGGKKPVALAHGPTWWALTRATVDYLMRQYQEDAWSKRSFKFSANPDEHYIQTLIGRPSNYDFMFADFSRPIKPWRFEEIDDIRATVPEGFLFVRKVNPAVPALADLIRTGVLRP